MKKKIIAFILCICLISSFCLQPAYAMGAEGAILGGAAGAAGLTLTMPQVALLVAAGFGLIYAINHGEDIANGLNNALNTAATNISNGMEELTYWKEQATKGVIALSSAPSWIDATVKAWILELYENDLALPNLDMQYSAGESFIGPQFWYPDVENFYYSFDKDVTVLRAGYINPWEDDDGVMHYSLGSYCTVVSTKQFTGSNFSPITINGQRYWYKSLASLLSMSETASKPLAGDNKLAYDAISTLPATAGYEALYPGKSVAEALIRAWVDGLYIAPTGSICPEQKVGGIEGAIDIGGIGNIAMPDMDIGDSELLFPDRFFPENAKDIDVVINDAFTRVKAKEITWERYVNDVFTGTPTVSIPVEGEADKVIDYPIIEEGVGDTPIDKPIDTPINPPANPPAGSPDVVVPEGLEPFTISLKDFFPFCIPFDIADFVNVLCAEPEAPSFEWGFPGPDGSMHKLTIDLSPFDEVAQILRNMELLLFCIGLALITRNQIRG